ncbi:MAG: hypothetical protein A3K90_03120 [Pelodictyon luteolum]|uniref:Yip1 domain-containing protein n=1 Tax=Pelodictyon luteolum TaxID=1100 RepID=A0A165LB42_PELLU|nr:MAG: hypothetical protein A3K90_03120 [Pelodictyon luteolum]
MQGGLKQLFGAMVAVLFRYRRFWLELKAGAWPEGLDVQRAYAVPVIAMVQLLKFPLIGVPRPAMFFAIASFIIDVAAFYVLSGATSRILFQEKAGEMEGGVVTVLSYAMTPVWLFELFYFTGSWSWIFALLALGHMLLISSSGFSSLFSLSGRSMKTAALFAGVLQASVFVLYMSLVRLFNF